MSRQSSLANGSSIGRPTSRCSSVTSGLANLSASITEHQALQRLMTQYLTLEKAFVAAASQPGQSDSASDTIAEEATEALGIELLGEQGSVSELDIIEQCREMVLEYLNGAGDPSSPAKETHSVSAVAFDNDAVDSTWETCEHGSGFFTDGCTNTECAIIPTTNVPKRFGNTVQSRPATPRRSSLWYPRSPATPRAGLCKRTRKAFLRAVCKLILPLDAYHARRQELSRQKMERELMILDHRLRGLDAITAANTVDKSNIFALNKKPDEIVADIDDFLGPPSSAATDPGPRCSHLDPKWNRTYATGEASKDGQEPKTRGDQLGQRANSLGGTDLRLDRMQKMLGFFELLAKEIVLPEGQSEGTSSESLNLWPGFNNVSEAGEAEIALEEVSK